MATNRSTTTRRTLHYYWQVTRKHFGLFAALMASTFLFVALLSYGNPYVMSLVVDRVSAGSVEPDQVFAVYSPYIAALIAINVLGQAASKLQDYTMYKLEIAAAYDLATMSFDALCNQSMSFHSNRFGGTLVSQTSKFMSAYQLLLETITFPFFAGYLLGDIHVRHSGAARAGIRGHPHGAASRIRLRFVLHVQANPFVE